ncbi:calmodulin-binding protein 60 F-like isoform X3 [Triticum dicoccoides]|uniref:calmodulin-binding protein 60 F-like isoform X3 n=1 Tax=Triticum dicoccoides TaxID=85692 RepID=UPI001891A9C4|nr:calmodulin-binding protein 60 F-like isoform X3 [Triticum dicoccoides]
MAQKRPLEATPPEQEAPRSPRKRLRRTVLLMMWLERRRARAVTVGQMEHMVSQAQLDMAKLFMLLMVLVARLGSMERLLLDLPNIVQTLLAQQFDALHRSVMVSIQDTIRSTVQTEIQGRQAASLPNGINEPPRQISEGFPETGGITGVKLRFVDVDRPIDTLFTGYPVQWQNGGNAKIAIFENDRQIMQGDLSKLQIEILAVHADFFTEQGQADFTKEELNKQIYMHKGKELVLSTVNLTNGESSLGSFVFPESSHGKKLRLTARVKRQVLTTRVQEAITDPFVVKDRRSELNKKSYPPSKEEAVHCLEKISLKGKHCAILVEKNITTVKHLMRQYHRDESVLQKLIGMKKGDWNTMIKHANTSVPGDEIYSYWVPEDNCEILFNDFYDLVGKMTDNYVPYSVNNVNQFPQHKVNNWKKSAYKKFDERESSGGLTPDYFMNDGRPVRAMPLNNDAGPSVQARPTWQYPNDMAGQHEFGDRRPLNGFSRAAVLSNNDAGPSNQETLPFSQPTYGQTMHQGTPYYLAQGNFINDQGQGSFSAEPTIPSHIPVPVPEDDPITFTAASLTGQQNGHLSFSTTDAPVTSYPVAGIAGTSSDGVSLGTSSVNSVQADIFSGLSPFESEELLELQTHLTEQDFVQANIAELPNSDNQFYGYEHDGGDR